MKIPPNGFIANSGQEGKVFNSELWHACAGPLVSVPPIGSLVVYFPQGHSEQVAASMQKETDTIPSYQNLPSKLVCLLRNVSLHADKETDEVYAQMTLQPVNKLDREALIASEIGLKQNRQPAEFFCKTLTASDTSTHGGFSVPRRAAEKIFPPLDFTMQPPAQELVAKDLHGQSWTFRHIYRGQPKRHLLTTGWSIFVSSKRLFAGDSVLFIRDEKSQLLLGIKRANRQQPTLASSVISSDSMHIGVLAAAVHAATNYSSFTIFYNPRASPAEFVIPLAKYNKALYTQLSLGMRFRMMFETEDSGVRRYMGTITGISDLDPVRWKNSQWRHVQVGWDESTAGERPTRVSVWDIEPVVTPFYICPPPFFRPKFSRQADDESDMESVFKRSMPWIGDDFGMKDAANSLIPGLSLAQWMSMQQNNQFSGAQPGLMSSMVSASAFNDNLTVDDPSRLLSFQTPSVGMPNLQLCKLDQQSHADQLQQPLASWSQQQQLQQMLQASINSQQQPLQQQMQKHQIMQQQQQHQLGPSSVANNCLYLTNQTISHNSQHLSVHPQFHKEQVLIANNQAHQALVSSNKSSALLTSLAPDMQYQQLEHQPMSFSSQRQQVQPPPMQVNQSPQQSLQESLSHRSSMLQNLPEQQLQLLLRMQQQQQNPQQNQLMPLNPIPQHQPQPVVSNIPTSSAMHSPQLQPKQLPDMHKSLTAVRHHSPQTEEDAPSCSTSPSTNQVPPSNVLRSYHVPNMIVEDSVVHSVSNFIPDFHDKIDGRSKNETSSSKISGQPKFKGAADVLEASSSATSYCLENNGFQQKFLLPNFGVDGDIQSHTRSGLPLPLDVNGLAPDALLSKGFDSGKDFQYILSSYSNGPRGMETELSAAAVSSQSFEVPNIMPFKAGCSNDNAMSDLGVLNVGIWANQTQCKRTYTKVQKRGSVGRCIDVNRCRDYDELRHDLARMFGIEGQLEDPQRTEWKLVYVDHENDILLVGDDPWEEFVSCVQSIKILSCVEVQQMSLDGDLGSIPVLNKSCSGADSGNAWRGSYEDHLAASFN